MSNPAPPSDALGSLDGGVQSIPAEQYGATYREHTLQIYKMYVEMADRISARRERANSFFLTVNAALVAFLAKTTVLGNVIGSHLLDLLVPLAGAVLCYLWYRIVRSYRDLNSAKFKVIHTIERQLPIRPYDAEWESVGRGKNPKLYLPFSHVEQVVPWMFVVFYAVLEAAILYGGFAFGWRVVG